MSDYELKFGQKILAGPDRAPATVVYSGLDGYGAVWGYIDGDIDNPPQPEIMLRSHYPSAHLPCIGDGWEIAQ